MLIFSPHKIKYILNRSENSTLLQNFIFCEKVLDKKYLLKLNNVSQTSSKRKLHQFVSFDVCVVPFLCFKLYSLNFAIAHERKKIVMIIRIGHTCVALKHKKTDLSLETSSESVSKFVNICILSPLTKLNVW